MQCGASRGARIKGCMHVLICTEGFVPRGRSSSRRIFFMRLLRSTNVSKKDSASSDALRGRVYGCMPQQDRACLCVQQAPAILHWHAHARQAQRCPITACTETGPALPHTCLQDTHDRPSIAPAIQAHGDMATWGHGDTAWHGTQHCLSSSFGDAPERGEEGLARTPGSKTSAEPTRLE